MRIRWTEPALRQIDEIFAYIATDNQKAAYSVVRYIENSVSLLGQFPEMGRPTDKSDVRVLVIGRYPYLVFYRRGEHEVEILHVRHGARQPEDDK